MGLFLVTGSGSGMKVSKPHASLGAEISHHVEVAGSSLAARRTALASLTRRAKRRRSSGRFLEIVTIGWFHGRRESAA
jgi:hypothetical protein